MTNSAVRDIVRWLMIVIVDLAACVVRCGERGRFLAFVIASVVALHCHHDDLDDSEKIWLLAIVAAYLLSFYIRCFGLIALILFTIESLESWVGLSCAVTLWLCIAADTYRHDDPHEVAFLPTSVFFYIVYNRESLGSTTDDAWHAICEIATTLHSVLYTYTPLRTPPHTFLPDASSVAGTEAESRTVFWTWAIAITYVVTVCIGTPLLRRDGFLCIGSSSYTALNQQTTSLSLTSKLRLQVAAVFLTYYGMLVAAVTWSVKTGRLSQISGLDWEIYWGVFATGCAWLLIQAALVGGNGAYAFTTFANASIPAMAPVVGDPYDTLKDVIFGGLCFTSAVGTVHWIGLASWTYLLALHAYLVWRSSGTTLHHLSEAYLGVYYAPKCTPLTSEYTPTSRLNLTATKSMLITALYKNTSREKVKLLLLEDIPQTIMAAVYWYFEPASSRFVLTINLTLPIARLALALLLHVPVKHGLKQWIVEQMKDAVQQRQPMRIRSNALAQLEAGRLHLHLSDLNLDDSMIHALAEGLTGLPKLRILVLDLEDNRIGDEGANWLAATLRGLVSLTSLEISFKGNDQISKTGRDAIRKAVAELPNLEKDAIALTFFSAIGKQSHEEDIALRDVFKGASVVSGATSLLGECGCSPTPARPNRRPSGQPDDEQPSSYTP